MGKRLTVNSFFAGIGGFDVGFGNVGFETDYFCEINEYCQEVISTHWPKAQIVSDIGSIKPDAIPVADVWCGGFPCQDISVARGAAGRKGLEGKRSGLFYQFANLIESCAPKVVLIENVEGLFNANGGRDFGVVLQRMTKLGYAVAWRLFNSRYFGVPQSRARVYICCWKGRPLSAARVMFEDRKTAKPKNARNDFITESNPVGMYPKVPRVAYCLAATSGRHTGTDWSRTYVACADGVRRMTPREYERLQGFPDNWTLPAGYNVDDEDTDTLRYTAIGNAVSIPVVEWVARRVKLELGRKCKTSSLSSVKKYVPEFAQSDIADVDLQKTDFTEKGEIFKWPKAGVAWQNACIGGTVPPKPSRATVSSLYALIEKIRVSDKYYLTPNAAKGILRRVDSQGRKLFQPLRDALERECLQQRTSR